MSKLPTVFVSADYKYMSDTCEPLKSGIAAKTIIWTGFKRGLYPGDDFKFDRDLDGLRLLAFWDASKAQNWGLPFHRNEGLEIGFVERGFADFSTDKKGGAFSRLTPQYITVTKPWQEHRIGNPNLTACKMHFAIIDFGIRRPNQRWKWPSWVLLNRQDKKDFADFMKNSRSCVFRSTAEIRLAFERLGKILGRWSEKDFSKIALLINTILMELLEIFRGDKVSDKENSPNEHVVKCFIEQLPNYCAEPWTLENMASDCGLKPTRFAYYCKLITNLTPIELLTDARLECAAKLLKNADDRESITEIAFRCGFSSSQYFSTKFRDKYGASPREFRLSYHRA